MVTLVIPNFASPRKNDYQPFVDKTPLRKSWNTALRLEHTPAPQRARQAALEG